MEAAENKRVIYEFGRFVLDPKEKTLLSDGRPVHLPAKEFETLLLLVEHNGSALSKEEMISAVWRGSFVEEGNLAKQISRLRKILNVDGGEFIETIPKHGYRFSADLRRMVPTADSLIVERRTVRQLTVSIEEEDAPTALPMAKPRSRKRLALASAIVAAIGLVFLAWYYTRPDVAAIDPYEPVRLTDDPNDDTGPSWTRDGRIRFFRIYSRDRVETMLMNTDGSDQKEIKDAEGRRVLGWSPDEKKILYQKNGDLARTYLANADGTGEALLPFRFGTWSPDSKMIAYRAAIAGPNHEIFIYNVDTAEIRNITNSEHFEADPSFSPDGERLLFASTRDGNGEIYSVGLDGGDLRRLTFHPATDSHAAYSPDGTAILFTSDRENENADVYIMKADGTGEPIKVTNWDKSNETAGPGSWSPDGTKIAFFSDRDGKDDIYVVSAETIRPKLVLSDPAQDIGMFSLSPDDGKIAFGTKLEDHSGELRVLDRETGRTTLVKKTEMAFVASEWSPIGDKIAFHDRVDGSSEIFTVNPDGSDLRKLTNDPSRDIGPAWSPDGKNIAFTTTRSEPQSSVPWLYVMNADGSDPHPITPRKGWEADPVWSPDGNAIFFACDRENIAQGLMDICRIGRDGQGEARVLAHRDYDTQPAISPDGKRIAFAARSDGNAEIYVMNSDGSGLFRVTRHLAEDQSPEWSHDGRKLLFASNRTGKFAIYEVEL